MANLGPTHVYGSLDVSARISTPFAAIKPEDVVNWKKLLDTLTGITLTAGDGLTGGGNLSTNRTFAVDNTVLRNSGDQVVNGSVKARSSGAVSKFTAERTDSNGNIFITFKGPSAFRHFGLGIDGHLYYGTDPDIAGRGAKLYSTTNKPSKIDVGLPNVPNYSATSSLTDGSTQKFATAASTKALNDKIGNVTSDADLALTLALAGL